MTTQPADPAPPNSRETALTDEVLRSFQTARSDRFQTVMTGLVRHLHSFARDVGLTTQEWKAAIDFLTATGDITSASRQEFILLSDVLGLSMMTVAINAPPQPGTTASTVFGPFFVDSSPRAELGATIAAGVSGRPCYIHGRITDIAGVPIADARVEVWEADDNGFYDVQYPHGELKGRAHLYTADDGRYDFWAVQPAAYPIPEDGPVGDLLRAAGRSPMRPAHIHFMVTAPGFTTLTTHIFVAGGPHLASDAVFGVIDNLIIDFVEREPGPGPRGRQLEESWVEAEFNIVMASAPAAHTSAAEPDASPV